MKTTIPAEERAALLKLPVWTREDVRAYFGLSATSFWRALKAGDLPAPMKRIGKRPVWDRDEVLFGLPGVRGREAVGGGVGSGPEPGAGGGERPALSPSAERRPFKPDFAFLRGEPSRANPRYLAGLGRALARCPEPDLETEKEATA